MHDWLCTAQVILSTCRKCSHLSTSKKSASSLTFFWRYCKNMQTFCFGYFGHACLGTPKMLVSTCRRLRCLSPCQKETSLFTSFLRYYILKNPAIWLAESILVTRDPELGRYGIGGKISMTILVFNLDYFQEKLITRFFKKSKKPYFAAILGPFCPNLGKNGFSWKKRLCQFLNIPIIYQKLEKTNLQFLRKQAFQSDLLRNHDKNSRVNA